MDRYGTVGRVNEFDFLDELGYTKRPIDKLETIIITNAKCSTDKYWIDFVDGEVFDKEFTK